MREQKNSHLGMIGWAMFLTGALSLGSCSSDDTIDAIQGEAITFGNVFVEKSTRAIDPSYGKDKAIESFQVWGKVTGNTGNTVNLYGGDGAIVTKGSAAYGAAWACSETEYWVPSATYNFMAIANAEYVSLTSGMPATISYTADEYNVYITDGSKDLLLAEVSTNSIKTVKTNNVATPEESPVAFTFSHLLSKAVFTFTNTESSTELKVSGIKMAGLKQKGIYTISGENKGWSSNTDYTSPLEFGGEVTIAAGQSGTSKNERLIIPGTYDITITFTVKDGKGGQDQNLSATIEDHEFLAGHSYNFTADIKSGLKYIVFIISSEDWSAGSDNNIQG